jgi:hypothetical protein
MATLGLTVGVALVALVGTPLEPLGMVVLAAQEVKYMLLPY